VTLFAAILGVSACWNLGVDLQRALSDPDEATRIALVSQASAAFLIPVIPAAAIWLFASRFARWLVTIASAGLAIHRVAMVWKIGPYGDESAVQLAVGLGMNALVLLLFAPSARRWFAAGRSDDAFQSN
jgi:hypothetical protein